MTITSQATEVSYAGDGASTVFSVPFVFDSASDLKVLSTDSSGNVTTLTSGFSVSGGAGSTGSVTFSEAPASGVTITILDDPLREQDADYVSNDAFPAEAHEKALDHGVRISKRLYQLIQHCLRTADGDPVEDLTLPAPATRANRMFTFDGSGGILLAPQPVAGGITQAILGELLYPTTDAEISAGLTIANRVYPPGYVDRYGTNTAPGSTNMLAAITAAFAQAAQSGGAPIVFQPVQYFLGTIADVATTLITVNDLSDCVIHGNGAQLRVTSNYGTNAVGTPTIIAFNNPDRVTIIGLRFFDTGFDITETWQGVTAMYFTTTDAIDRGGIRLIGCDAENVVAPWTFTSVGGGTGRLRGIHFGCCTVKNCYYGANFEEQGDDVTGSIIVRGPVRAYFPYGVSAHDVTLGIYHDASSTGSNACIDIKRYENDTRDIKIRAVFHGYVSQYGAIVNLETNTTAGTAAITALGSITGGTGGTQGVYWGVPLTGGSGAGATAQITVGSAGAVLDVQISNPGKGYAASDSLSAASADIGSCSGFAIAVAGVGGIIDGIDIDVHLIDAQVAKNTNPPPLVQYRSLAADGSTNATTTDKCDRIVVRGNAGQFPHQQQGNLYPINILSAQTGAPGRLSIGGDLFGAFDYFKQGFPGFVLKLANNKYAYTKAGDLTAVPISIDLSRYRNRLWALRICVVAQANYSTSASDQTYVEQFVQGLVGADGTPLINNSHNIVSQFSGSATALTFDVSDLVLTVAFSAYTGSNAYARVTVEDVGKLL